MTAKVGLLKGAVASVIVGAGVYSGGWFLYELLKWGEWLSFSGCQSLLFAAVALQAFFFLALGFREYGKTKRREAADPVAIMEATLIGDVEKEAFTELKGRMDKLESRLSDAESALKLKPLGNKK